MKTLDDDDDDVDGDRMPVPAGRVRVTIGLTLMTGGVLMAALIDKSWAKGVGLALFILSPFVMLRNPPKDNG